MKKTLTIIVVILLIGIGVLYLTNKKSENIVQKPNGGSGFSQSEGDTKINIKTQRAMPEIGDIQAQKAFMSIKSPDKNLTPSELEDYSKKIKAVAVESEIIDITKCSPTPLVLWVKMGKKIIFRNDDSKNHIIGLTPPLEVPAKSEISVEPNSAKWQLGNLGYTCDGNGPVGMFYITN